MEELSGGGRHVGNPHEPNYTPPSPSTKEFDLENDMYDHNWPFQYRYHECDLLLYNSDCGLKVHVVKHHGKNDVTVTNEQVYNDSL